MVHVKKIIESVARLQSHSIGIAALIVAVFGVLSRFMGLVRDRVLAANYGAGDTLDIYYAAFRLPDLIFELLIVGSLAAAFVPHFTKLLQQDNHDRAWRCANDLFLLLLGVLCALSAVGFIFAPALMHVIVPGFDAAKSAATADFARVMFFSPLFLTASALFGSVLVSMRKFILYASAPLFYNAGIIVGIVFFAPYTGDIGLAYGVVFGAFLHFVVHTIAVSHAGFDFSLPRRMPYKNKDVRFIMKSMLPRIFGSASNQIALLLTTMTASLLSAGALTMFTFAYNVQSVVLGVVGVSFALAAFPTLSAAFANQKKEYFTATFIQTFRRILYYAIPLSVLFWILRAQVIRLVYGAGNFDPVATSLTIDILSILLMSVFAQCLIPLLARSFYAMNDTKTPLYAALSSQAVNMFLLFTLLPLYPTPYRVEVIAVAFTISAIINAAILAFLLVRRLENVPVRETCISIIQITLAAFFAGGVAHMVKNFVGGIFTPQIYVWQYLVQFSVTFIVGIVLYLGISAVFGLKEYETIRKKIFFKLFGRPIVAAEEQNQGTGSH